jgi:hypothetical protein
LATALPEEFEAETVEAHHHWQKVTAMPAARVVAVT